MMKKALFASALLIAACVAAPSLSAQDKPATERPNEVYGGYGAGSLYYFTGPISHNYKALESSYYYTWEEADAPTSIGTFFIGYNRAVNRILSIGVAFSYMHLEQNVIYYEDPYYTGNPTEHYGVNTDHLLNGMARITVAYLQKKTLSIYSGAAIGVTVDLGTIEVDGIKDTERKLKPAGQLTLFGLRVGRALGGFMEFGFGTNGLVTAGISYRIKD